jgi:hypothetical protein
MILSMVMRQGLRLALIGVGFALVGTRWLGAVLYGVAPTDLVTYLVGGGLLAVALAAAVVPATRAAKVPPIITRRDEG